MTEEAKNKKTSTREALKQALKDRQVLAMLILGLAAGLPYGAVGGTLNAWLSTVDVKPSAIGLLSWAFLAYAFKFMWAAAFQSRKTPFNLKIGSRRFWMCVFIILMTIGFFALSFSTPPEGLAMIGLISVLIAIFSASFDIVVAAWRIEAARDDMHLDILSTVEQFGYRTASLLTGFVALILADNIGWRLTFMSGTVLMALTLVGVMLAQPTHVKSQSETLIRQGGNLTEFQRRLGTLLVLSAWAVAFYMIASFMTGALRDPENHSARDFIRYKGPIIIGITVVWLGVVSAVLVFMNGKQKTTLTDSADKGILAILYQTIVEPMMELVGRLRCYFSAPRRFVLSFYGLNLGGVCLPVLFGGELRGTRTHIDRGRFCFEIYGRYRYNIWDCVRRIGYAPLWSDACLFCRCCFGVCNKSFICGSCTGCKIYG